MEEIKNKNILFVMPKFAPGGAEKSLLMLLYELCKVPNISVDLLLFKKEGAYIDEIPKGINLISESSLNCAYAKFNIKNFKSIRNICISIIRPVSTAFCKLFSKNANVMHQRRWGVYKLLIKKLKKTYDYACAYLDGESMYYVADKVLAKHKIAWNQNDYLALKHNKKIDERYYRKFEKVVSLSDKCVEILNKEFPQLKDYICNIAPLVSKEFLIQKSEEFYPVEFVNDERVKLISVGRLVYQKGFDYAIQAGVLLKRSGLNFVWYIIGNGELYDELKHQILLNDLERNIVLLGEKVNPYPYMVNSDIFVQTSRFEGKSVILSEAKVLCMPIVVTSYPTVYDQIIDGEEGIICDIKPNKIAESIQTILDEQIKNKFKTNLELRSVSDADKLKYFKLFDLSF